MLWWDYAHIRISHRKRKEYMTIFMKKEEIKKLLKPDQPELLLYMLETAVTGVFMTNTLTDYGKHLRSLDPITQAGVAVVDILTPLALTYAIMRGYKLMKYCYEYDCDKKKKL